MRQTSVCIPVHAKFNSGHLTRIIIDASARRHQAHKIYLRVAAAKRWVLNRNYVVSKFNAHELAAQVRDIDGILHNVRLFSRINEASAVSHHR